MIFGNCCAIRKLSWDPGNGRYLHKHDGKISREINVVHRYTTMTAPGLAAEWRVFEKRARTRSDRLCFELGFTLPFVKKFDHFSKFLHLQQSVTAPTHVNHTH